MNRTARLNLLLGVDPREFKSAIDKAIGGELRRVKVNVDVQLDGAGDSFGRSAVAQISKATIKADFSNSVADQLATRIAKATGNAVEDAVRKGSKGDFLGDASNAKVDLRIDRAGVIGDIIANKITEGIEKSLKDVGRKGAAGNILGAIGSVVSAPLEIAGNVAGGLLSSARLAATSAVQGLVNGIGVELTQGIGAGLRAGIDQKLGSTFGSTELIGKTAASQLLNELGKAANQIETQVSAADSPLKDVAKVLKSEFGRLIESAFDPQEVLAVSRAAQRRARQQRGQIEVDASEELLAEKQRAFRKVEDFREQAVKLKAKNQADIQKLRDQAAAEAPGLEQTIASVAQRSAQPTQRLAEVNASRQQILDSYQNTPASQRSQAKQQFETLSTEAKQLEANLAALQKEQAIAVGRIEQFSNKFDQLQAINTEIDEVLRQAIAQAQTAIRNQKSVGTPEERRTEAERQAKETETEIQATQVRQQEIGKQRATGIEIGRKVAVKAQSAFEAGDREQFLDLSAEADLALRIIAQLDTEFEELAETRRILETKAERLKATLKSIPEGLPEAVKQAYLDLSGKLPDPDQIPSIRDRSTETLGTAKAVYSGAENTIAFRSETFAAIQAGQKLTEDQLKELYEEVAHSLQLDFGKLRKDNFQKFNADATPAQIEPVLQELTQYDEFSRPIELDAKIIRDQKVAQALVRQELQELTETIGTDGTELYKLAATKLNAAQASLKAAAATGIDTTPFEAYVARLSDLARTTSAEFARLSIEKFEPERLQVLMTDVKKTLKYLDDLDAVVASASTKSQPAPQTQQAQGGALTIAREQAAELGGVVQRAAGALAPIAGVAEGAVSALAIVGKAGLALADKFGFAAASLAPGGALAYGPAKAVVGNVVGPLAVAGVASQVPGVGEVLGVLQQGIAAVIQPETVGLANGISSAVAAELHSALPTLFSTLSRGLAESGLPGAGLSSQAVDAVGGLLVRTLEPAVNGVISVADATIRTVGSAAQDLLSQLGAALAAGKVVQEGAKLATSQNARSAALKGVETVGSGIGQVVGGVQEGIEGIRDAVGRTSRAVEQSIQDIKQASDRVAQGEISAVGDIVEGVQSVASHVSRGAQDIGKASSQAAQDVAEGVGKAVSVFGDLQSVKLPDGIQLGDLAQQQLIKIQTQLRQKLERVLDAEAQGLPVIGGSGTVRRDLELVGQVLEAKYEVVLDHVADQVQKQIQSAPIELSVKVDLPELDPIPVEVKPSEQSKALVPLGSTQQKQQSQEISPITQAQEQLRSTPQSEAQRPSLNSLVAEVDAAIAETDDEVKRVYGYFAEIIDATKKAIKKGDVEAIARNTSEAKRIANELANQIASLQRDIAQSIPVLKENGIDAGPDSAIGERLRKTKSALGQKAALIPQRLASVGATPDAATAEVIKEIDTQVSQQINTALSGITDGLNQKAKQLRAALANLVGEGLAGAATGLSQQAEQTIAESERNLAQVEQQLNRLEARADDAEKLSDRLEAIVTEKELGQTPGPAEFDQRLNAPAQNSAEKTEERRQELDQARLRKLEELRRRIAQVEGEIDKNLASGLQPDPSKALVPIQDTQRVEVIAASERDISKALVAIQAVGKGIVAYDANIQQTQEKVKSADEQLKELTELLLQLKRDRDAAEKEIQSFQAEDLNAFKVPRQTFDPSQQERAEVLRQRLLRDQSERQISKTLKDGTAPKGTPDELQNLADSATASFDRNAAKFEAAAKRLEGGSTTAQKAFSTVGEGVNSLKQKLSDAGGISGVLGKVGESFRGLAEKAGLPVGAIGKLGGIIKGVGIAALAYVGITQLGDALVELGRRAFEVSTRVETLQTQLKFVGGESNLPENLEFIRKESERLKRPLDQVTEGLTSLSIATKDTSLEGRTQEIASAIGTLGRVYGLSNQNLTSIQYQLGQTIRLGRAQGDELRSLSDAGVNVFKALEKVLGISASEVTKRLEAGQISATATVDALKLLADTAKSGLPEALKTSQASLDDLNRKFTEVAVSIGEKLKPAVVGGLGTVGAAIDLAVAAGEKIKPVFSAIGQAFGLIGDLASPVVGVIQAIVNAVGEDFVEGFIAPFRFVGQALTGIREQGEKAEKIFSFLGGAFNDVKQKAVEFLEKIPGFSILVEYANPATLAVRALGGAIGVFLTAQLVGLGVSATQAVGKLLIMAATFAGPVIAAVSAATAAAWRFVLTPLGATIAGIAAVATLAAPHIDDLALAYVGLSQAQNAANEQAIAFNTQYIKGLDQLQKGVPLTAEKLQELKNGFIQNAKEGKGTAKEVAILSANLDRLQANAQNAAKIQGDLADAMKKSTEAIKNQSKAIDSDYNERLAGLNESLAAQAITREEFDAAELDAQQEKTAKYVELYKTQGDRLRDALKRAQYQLSQPIPDSARDEVLKQVIELEAQINDIETKSSESRIGLAQNRIKATENLEKARVKRAEDETKRVENQRKQLENLLAAGVGDQIATEERISALKQKETNKRIAEIDRQIKVEIVAHGKGTELAKNLYSDRAALESELTKIVAEQATKRYDLLLKDLEKNRDKLAQIITEAEVQSNIELQKAQNAGLLQLAEVEAQKTKITRDRLKKELILERANIEALQSLPSPTDPEKAEEHQKRIREGKLKTAQLTQSLAENEYKRQQEIRQAAEKAIDEQVKGVENAANAIEQLGKVSAEALERQTKILEAQKSLRQSIVGLHDEEFKILIETTTEEEKKADLQEKAAKFRLDSLKASQALEEKILKIQLAQEEVQNRVAVLKAQAAVAKSTAEKAKVDANPESTAADKQAAALGLEASEIELGATIETGRLQQELVGFKRQQAQVGNRKDLLGAQFDYAKSIVDPKKKEDAIKRVQQDASRGLKTRYQDVKLPVRGIEPDYTQIDSAQQQLGLVPKNAKLGRFIPPTPVNLHGGAGNLSMQMLDDSKQLKELINLAKEQVKLGQATNLNLSAIATRKPTVTFPAAPAPTRKPQEASFAGLPI
jgi:tape measure domain-containing protein